MTSDITFVVRPECPICGFVPQAGETHAEPREVDDGLEYVCTMSRIPFVPKPGASGIIYNITAEGDDA